MAAATLRKEEGLALGIALAAHAVLFVWLALARPGAEPLPLPETMTVTLSDEIAPTSTAPAPAAQPSAAAAPELGEVPPPAPLERIQPSPVPTPPVRVAERTAVKPPSRAALTLPPRPAPSGRPGAQRVSRDFLKGVSAPAGAGPSTQVPAAQIGANVVSSLNAEVQRQLKARGRWAVPQGVETDQLVTFVSFRLNRDGTISGAPTARTVGLTEANRSQVAQHQERAIRAVRLTAPFMLPAQYYDAWDRIEAKFDRRLAQ